MLRAQTYCRTAKPELRRGVERSQLSLARLRRRILQAESHFGNLM